MAHPLVPVWLQAHRDFRDAASHSPWHHATVLPGWSVADIVAHTIWIERTALGRHDPPHEPDFNLLRHATTPFARRSEAPVDLRRQRSRDAVLAELDETVTDRERELRELHPEALQDNIFGVQRPLGDVLTDRVFDLWVHEQDIRVAVGAPGHLATEPARVAAGVLLKGLGFVWGKRADAPVGTTLEVRTTGPGLELKHAVARFPDGRARPVPLPAEPTTRLTTSFGNFVALTCGRTNADPAAVNVAGDRELGRAVVRGFAITP